MEREITQIIKGITQKKMANNQQPSYALMVEISRELNVLCRNALNKMYQEGKIKVGDTMNDKYIELL